ncbi:MAG: kynureninase [Candidatus Latescibacteria bacterium]|nr:kynureninase [Candidatus Latescibacterota bacterium]
MRVRTDPGFAREQDERDELAGFRSRFVIDDPALIYLDGNSLGRLPVESATRAQRLVGAEWGQRLIRGWNEGWLGLAERVGAKLARLVGAAEDEVIVADSTSVNLFKLVAAALQARPGRTVVITDDLNFPSDVYILQSALKLAGPAHRLEIVRSPDGLTVPIETLAGAIDSDTALVALSHTAFKSGSVYDMATVTAVAHRAGALILWDVSHSVGAMPLSLDQAAVDLAVGCTYKYVNGGPGAPAFLFVRRDLHDRLHNPIAGWFGHQAQFEFTLEYRPAQGIRRFLTGTPSVVSLALIEPGVDLLLEAGLERVRAKSVRQTDYLIALWEALLAPVGFTLHSPRDAARRGSHVSLGHPDGLRIDRALIEQMHVIPDFRYPDHIRLGVAPLYTTYTEIHTAVMALRTVVVERLYEQYPATRRGVT